tara:strand:+ start:10978 stop:11754 length:777 start_codon:yes stop_codon:yes gene_type:complete
MNLQLDGQGVIVFGAARGIGHAIASAFAAEGCRVVGFDRQQPTASSEIKFVEFVSGDVSEIGDVRRVADLAVDIQHVVFSVGVGSGVSGFPFWNLNPSDWTRVIDVNLLGAVNVAHVFAPKLADRRQGTFLFLASVAGQTGSQTDPPYSAAKAALINFMQCSARDLAPFGVRSNAISPGMVQSELTHSIWEASQTRLPESERRSFEAWSKEKLRRVSPLGRWQSAEECAAMAIFLASQHAKNITGQTINIDGGQVMHC